MGICYCNRKIPLIAELKQFFCGSDNDRYGKEKAPAGTDESAVVNINGFQVRENDASHPKSNSCSYDCADISRNTQVLNDHDIASAAGEAFQGIATGRLGDCK